MLLEEYIAGVYEQQAGYKAFIPSKINKQWEWKNPKINILLEQATMELGGLNSYSELIPNIDVYIQMHINVEANKSSKIEGTKTTIEEDLSPIQDLNPEKRKDVQEVQNYLIALQHGVERITSGKLPLSSRLICEIHSKLMKGVRGEHKTPGEYRRSQNWIGGSKPSSATYVPPPHIQIPDLISDLEHFIHNNEIQVPQFIRIAMAHYQFESIHPFLDGNGRTGRIVIPLHLLNSGMLSKPSFYISDYFEAHRTEYYDALSRVRLNNDMFSWVIFFLEASIETARSAKVKFRNALDFVNETNLIASKISGTLDNVQSILNNFYKTPVQIPSSLAQSLDISPQTVNRILDSMVQNKVVQEGTGNIRNRIFIMEKYLDIFR